MCSIAVVRCGRRAPPRRRKRRRSRARSRCHSDLRRALWTRYDLRTGKQSNLCDYLQYFFLLSVVTVVLLTGAAGALLRATPRGSAAGEGNEAAREISCPSMPAFYFPSRLALLWADNLYDIFHGTFIFQAGAVGHFLRG